MFDFQPEYLTAGGNRHPSAADWDAETGLLAFGANRNVAIWSALVSYRFTLHRTLPKNIDRILGKEEYDAFSLAIMML